jgi:hypothetical protein
MSLHSEIRTTQPPLYPTASTCFLDLPREIRDMIYSYALTSPSGYMAPVLSKHGLSLGSSKCNNSRSPSHRLLLIPCNSKGEALHGCEDPKVLAQRSRDTALASFLPIVNRQIYGETSHLLWGTNALLCTDPKTLVIAMKHMGQAASRRVERVLLRFNPFYPEDTNKAFSMLASRSRSGRLRDVTLVPDLCSMWLRAQRGPWERRLEIKSSMALFETLQRGAALGWGPKADDGGSHLVVRRLVVDYSRVGYVEFWDMLDPSGIEPIGKELHGAWGGELVVNGACIWKDFKRVAMIEGLERDGTVVAKPENGWMCDETIE